MMDATDPEMEARQGRVAVWLSPEHIALIIEAARQGRSDGNEATAVAWGDIQFRMTAALHKANLSGG